RVWQRSEDHGVEQAEHRSRGAGAETECEHRGDRERGLLRERADCKSDVLPELRSGHGAAFEDVERGDLKDWTADRAPGLPRLPQASGPGTMILRHPARRHTYGHVQ